MATTKTIGKAEQFKLSTGPLFIKSIPGDGHLTYSRIYQNGKLIKAGEGIIETSTTGKAGDEIFITTTINKPNGSSDFASLTIEMNDDHNSDRWVYSSSEPDFDVVVYEVTITLT